MLHTSLANCLSVAKVQLISFRTITLLRPEIYYLLDKRLFIMSWKQESLVL